MFDEFNNEHTIEKILGEQIANIYKIFEDVFEMDEYWLDVLRHLISTTPLITYVPISSKYGVVSAKLTRVKSGNFLTGGVNGYEVTFDIGDQEYLSIIEPLMGEIEENISKAIRGLPAGPARICAAINTGNLISSYGEIIYEYFYRKYTSENGIEYEYDEDDFDTNEPMEMLEAIENLFNSMSTDWSTDEENFFKEAKPQLAVSINSTSKLLSESLNSKNMGFYVLGTPFFAKQFNGLVVQLSVGGIKAKNIPFVAPIK